MRLCRITSSRWSVVLRQDPRLPRILERRLPVSLFILSTLPTVDFCHAAEDTRLAVHEQSFLNLPRQNGRLLTKVFMVFYCISLSLSLVKIKMKTKRFLRHLFFFRHASFSYTYYLSVIWNCKAKSSCPSGSSNDGSCCYSFSIFRGWKVCWSPFRL